MCKNYAGIRCLLDILEEVSNDLQSRLEGYQVSLDEASKKVSRIKEVDEEYVLVNEDGTEEIINRWDTDYYRSQVKSYADRISAYNYVLSLLASVDLNKVKM